MTRQDFRRFKQDIFGSGQKQSQDSIFDQMFDFVFGDFDDDENMEKEMSGKGRRHGGDRHHGGRHNDGHREGHGEGHRGGHGNHRHLKNVNAPATLKDLELIDLRPAEFDEVATRSGKV